MKKLLVALGLGALLMGTVAMADSQNRAWVIEKDDGYVCGWQAGSLVMLGYVHEVWAKNGNTKYICTSELFLTDPPEEVTKYKNFPCDIFSRTAGDVSTLDTKAIFTPDGEARVECSFKANKVMVE